MNKRSRSSGEIVDNDVVKHYRQTEHCLQSKIFYVNKIVLI